MANKNLQRQQLEIRGATFSGPIPPPDLLREYNEIIPNGADRIVTMAENQSAHRITLERRVVFGDDVRAYLGLGTAFIVAVFGLYLSYRVIMAGHDLAGSALGAVDLASLVSVFIYGTRARRQERARKEQKNRALAQTR
jgi:uncharacterized membrane protein